MSYNQRIGYSVAAAALIIVVLVALLPGGAIIPDFKATAEGPEPPSIVNEAPDSLLVEDTAEEAAQLEVATIDPPKAMAADPEVALQAQPQRPRITPAVRLPDTSFVYQLPYPPNVAYQVMQATQGDGAPADTHILAFAVPEETSVLATRSGRVDRIRHGVSGSGKRRSDENRDAGEVSIEHADGTIALYGRLKRGSIRVSVGDSVTVNQPIAECGSTPESYLLLELLMIDGDEYRTFPFQVATRTNPAGQILTAGHFDMRPESTLRYPANSVASMEAVDDRYIPREEYEQFDAITILVRLNYSREFPLRIEFERPHIESRIQRPIEWHDSGLMAWSDLERDDTKYHTGPWRAVAYFGDQEMASVGFLVKKPGSF